MNNFKDLKYGDCIYLEYFGGYKFDPPISCVFLGSNIIGDIGLVALSQFLYQEHYEDDLNVKTWLETVEWGMQRDATKLILTQLDVLKVEKEFEGYCFMYVADPTYELDLTEYTAEQLLSKLNNEIKKTRD